MLPDGSSPFAQWFGSLEATLGRTEKCQQQDIDRAVALWGCVR
jgi:hypothetical protein